MQGWSAAGQLGWLADQYLCTGRLCVGGEAEKVPQAWEEDSGQLGVEGEAVAATEEDQVRGGDGEAGGDQQALLVPTQPVTVSNTVVMLGIHFLYQSEIRISKIQVKPKVCQ